MKAGAENRKKTITLGVLGAALVCGVLYNLFAWFGGPSTPPPSVAPLSSTPAAPVSTRTSANGTASPANRGSSLGIAGVAAQKLATSSASLDPTLDQAAMLRTESLVYSGSGRNIFSATYTAPLAAIPTNVPPPRPSSRPTITLPSVPTGPPPPPPIPLKFFGTAQRAHGVKQAFLLSGDDVYLASPGDIVARRFKVGAISSFGIQITDLTSNNTQTLPLLQN